MDPQIIGNRLKALTTMKNIKRKDFAEKLGISYNTLTKKLNGQREFNINEILMIKQILELDVDLCANIFFNSEFLFTSDKKII